MTTRPDDWLWLEQWYASRCDGDWEHQHGIRISTLDNPGWLIEVDVEGTPLDSLVLQDVFKDHGPGDWLHQRLEDGKFLASGDPSKLATLVAMFRRAFEDALE